MRIAITREVSPAIVRCQLTFLPREPIDLGRAAAQHENYRLALADLGCRVKSLPAEPDLPDSVFVEDTAVVLDELAVVARPGAAARRDEVPPIARLLAEHRPVAAIEEPGTLDGGDVLVLDRNVYVGLSSRTNREGIGQLRARLAPLGYPVEEVPVTRCLHLKSAVTQVAPGAVLLDPAWVDRSAFDRYRIVETDPGEPHAANALLVGDAVIYPAAFPRTAERLERARIRLVTVDVSELAKAEGAVTCCSLILRG